MTTYRDFMWMQDATNDLQSIAESLAREADEINALGDTAAAVSKLEESSAVSVERWNLRMTFLREPAYEQFRMLCLAQGSELTGEAVTRIAATAAAKRGLTLHEIGDLSAVEVAAMAASDMQSVRNETEDAELIPAGANGRPKSARVTELVATIKDCQKNSKAGLKDAVEAFNDGRPEAEKTTVKEMKNARDSRNKAARKTAKK